MLQRGLCLVVMTSLLLSLTGCACLTPGYVKKRRLDYLCARERPPLRLPACASGVNIGEDFVIPPVACPCPTAPVCIIPPGCPTR